MTYAPVIPVSGYAGWTFLKKTMATQKAAFVKSPEIKRDEDYFRAKIGSIKTAGQLVADRRLMTVALGAFGLDADIDNKAFIQKILTDGTLNAGALANRLADKQYLKLSAAFGFGDFAIPSTQLSDFADKIVSAYEARSFESAVGNQDGDLRLALNVQRELATLAGKTSSETVKWLTILGNAPLKQVFQKALGLPANVSALGLDQQLSLFQDRAQTTFGDKGVSQFTNPDKVESLIRRFLVRSQADAVLSTIGSGSVALTLLQQSGSFSNGLL